MNSTIGFSPANAAPTPRPAKACSVIGVSMTRRAPNSGQQALRHLVGALIFGDFLTDHEHVGIAAHFLGHGVAQRLAHGHGDHLGAFRHLGLGQRLSRRRRGGPGFRRRRRFGFLCRLVLLRGRRRFRGFLLPRRLGRVGACLRRRAGLERGLVLALGEDHGDRRIDRDIVGAFRHQNLSQRALVDRFHLHGSFVGLDFRDDVAGLDGVALLLEPLGKIALLHGRGERGHENLNWHGGLTRRSSRPRKSRAPVHKHDRCHRYTSV